MNELNKKMLKFAGFKRANIKEHYHYESGKRVADWLEPCGVSRDVLPRFDLWIDACFEHLEPELYRRGFRYQLTRLQDGHRALIFAHRKRWANIVADAFDKKPATAFCKAVEILIDNERKRS